MSKTSLFWKGFENYWFSLLGNQVELKRQDVMMGKTEVASDLLNYLIIPGKLHIWKSQKTAINQLPHVWGPKIIILNSNKTITWCGSKGGSG